MIEHCLWSVALARDEGPLLATVLRGDDAEAKRMIKGAIGGPMELPAEVADLVNNAPRLTEDGSDVKTFAAVCRKLGR